MKIQESGFYKLSDILEDGNIEIAADLQVSIFDDLSQNSDIYIGKNSKIEIFGVLENTSGCNIDISKKIIQEEESSEVGTNYIILSKDSHKIQTEIISHLKQSNTHSEVNILSFIGNDGEAKIDGVIQVDPSLHECVGHLHEENIFLGNTGRAKAIPTLLISSDDVEASHACKMDRINDEKLFYLRSRGIGKENALNMLIESYVKTIFGGLKQADSDFYEQVVRDICERV